MKGVYRAKHDLLLELLRPFQGRFRIRGEHAGIHILLEERSLPSGTAEGRTQTVRERELQLMAEAERAGVRVYGSSRYYLEGEAKSATILLGFARMSTEEIREAVKRLGEAWGI